MAGHARDGANEASTQKLECVPSTDCDCAPPATSHLPLSWPATIAIVAAGTLLCLVIVKLLGA